ncbi:hypothetical protein [Micromonospora sp. NBS 11-29]|uniref:hypothetical protein n=1 Tax=Micromonospora sp. NBS 11-29 TaxID=1960879 RepID=UPI0020CC521A|nr:hypothetical protein [Micromonospora sp. NBS 11-29]
MAATLPNVFGAAISPPARFSMPRNTWPGFCCSLMYAVTTTSAPVSAGIAHWSIFICRWLAATFAGV